METSCRLTSLLYLINQETLAFQTIGLSGFFVRSVRSKTVDIAKQLAYVCVQQEIIYCHKTQNKTIQEN